MTTSDTLIYPTTSTCGIAARFEKESGRQLKLTFGSSGNFANQIAQRAPFELFLSADEGFVFRLADAGLTEDRGTLYSIGRIVLFVPKASPVKPEVLLSDLPGALAVQLMPKANEPSPPSVPSQPTPPPARWCSRTAPGCRVTSRRRSGARCGR